MKKYLFLFLILFPSILFSADLRNLSVSPSTVSPGQQVTISFEYYVPDWGQFAYFAAISNQCSLRSADTSTTEQQFKVRENCMDCEHAYVNGGRQSVQHQVGGWRTSSEIDSNILLTVPSDWSSGTYYIIVGYKDFNIYVNPNLNQVSEQCFSINVVSELTSTPTETPTEVIGSATPVEFHVEYKSGSSETNIIKPFVRIYNDSDTDLQLGDAVIKYWYKYEGVEQVETVTIYSASVNGASYTDVKSYTFGEVLLQERGDQNRLMQISFSSSAGVLGPGEYLEVQSGIQKADFSDYDQTNDWGYNSSFSDFSAWGRVVMDSNIGIYSSEPWHRQSPPIVIRVNVGDPFNDYIDTLGNTWERTRSYAPGGWGYGGPAYGGGNPSGWQWLPDTLDIGNTLDDPLYRKIAMSQLGSPLRYLFDIPNAEYEVTLKFNQFDYPVPSVFDVEIEGNNVLSNYSIHSEVGYNTAKDYTFNVVLTDGQLNIDLIPIQQWALVAAIEVREIAVDTPTYTPTETFTNTNTETFTDTPTDTVTDTSTETFTETNTETFTDTPTETFTDTFTETFTDTLTDTPTETFTDTNTNTYTETYTDTPTETFTETETYTITETFTITDTPTETHTNTDTETPTETTTPFIVPTNVIETKDCAIHWLHSMQILDQAGYPHEYGSWANQNEWGYNDPIRTNVGMTGLVILSFLNEGVYDYYDVIAPDPGAYTNWTSGQYAVYDPAVQKGIDYLLRNIQTTATYNGHDEGPITDITHAAIPNTSYVYDTSCSLIALTAYRRLARSVGAWSTPGTHAYNNRALIEQAMESGWRWLLNVQKIERVANGNDTNLISSRIHSDLPDCSTMTDIVRQYYEPWDFEPDWCQYGGWGYPGGCVIPNHADMSNTQFAVWALEVLDAETRTFGGIGYSVPDSFAAPLTLATTTVLPFYPARQDKAYIYIKRANTNPEDFETSPPTLKPNIGTGGLYGTLAPEGGSWVFCGSRNSHNDGNPYGSMTAAGVWGAYCTNRTWTIDGGTSDPLAWNEVEWLRVNYTTAINPNMVTLGGQKWYYYHVMSFMKASLMQNIPIDYYSTPNWYLDFYNELITGHPYTSIAKAPYDTPTDYGKPVCYWSGVDQESDTFSTVAAILGLETKISSYYLGNKLIVELLSPAELSVIDDYDNQTGCQGGVVYTNIPDSTFNGCASHPQRVEIDKAGGSYTVRLNAIEDGYVTLKVRSQFLNNDMSEYAVGLTVTAGELVEYRVGVGNVQWPMTLACSFARGQEVTPGVTATKTDTFTITPTVTITSTITATATVTPTYPETSADISVTFKTGDASASTSSIHPFVRIYNNAEEGLDVSSLEVRYWYQFEGDNQAEITHKGYMGIMPAGTNITNNAILDVVSGDFGDNQNRYHSITFDSSAGAVPSGGYLQVESYFNKYDWSQYDQSNDWSFLGSVNYTAWDKVTVYENGVLIWGEEPGGGEMGTLSMKDPVKVLDYEDLNESNTYNYPNPCKNETIIRFSLAEEKEVRIAIYSLNGNLVWTKSISESDSKRGINHILWRTKNDSGQDVANGVYLCKIITDGKVVTKKIAVVK